MKRYMENIITGCRMIFSIGLLMFPVFSFWFYVMYLAGGITDSFRCFAKLSNLYILHCSHLFFPRITRNTTPNTAQQNSVA